MDQIKPGAKIMNGTVGEMSVLVEISCLRICVVLAVVCGRSRYYSLWINGVSTCLSLSRFRRTVKAREMVCVAGTRALTALFLRH